MRLHTLPVSVAGVLCGVACAVFYRSFEIVPSFCCMLFALGAQIASNLANEYFDYRNGLDKKGREGFRRGVTEGDISPKAMLRATILTLALSCLPGLLLIYYGGWWMILVGILVAIFALAYSAGPYPLSHHGLGDIAVIIFFGLVPVILTTWLQNHSPELLPMSLTIGLGVGLLAANVLIVNNTRDIEDDRAVGKHTTAVIFGKKAMTRVYLAFGTIGLILLCSPAYFLHTLWFIFPLVLIPIVARLYKILRTKTGKPLNNVLRKTAITLLLASFCLIVEAICYNF